MQCLEAQEAGTPAACGAATYHQHQLFAVGDPSSFMSIIMDGSTNVILPFCIPTSMQLGVAGNGIPFGETLNKLRDGDDTRLMSHSNNKGGEHLIDVLMCVAHREERHGKGAEHLVGNQPMTLSKHVLTCGLTATVGKLKVECTGFMCFGCSEYLMQVRMKN